MNPDESGLPSLFMLQKDGKNISFPRPAGSRSPTQAHKTQLCLSIHVLCLAPRGWVVMGEDGENVKGESTHLHELYFYLSLARRWWWWWW